MQKPYLTANVAAEVRSTAFADEAYSVRNEAPEPGFPPHRSINFKKPEKIL
jgi:hypothetical protein